MGLRNAPLTCQCLVNSIFAGIIGNVLLLYLDDLLVVPKDLDSNFQKLNLISNKLVLAGLN